MTLEEDLRMLGRMTYRQFAMILLAGLVTWWFVNAVFALIGLFIVELMTLSFENAAMWTFYVSAFINPISTILGLIGGLWVGYATFGRFKKTIE